MNKDFDILDDPWWGSPYYSPPGAIELLERVETYRNEITRNFCPKDPYWIGYMDVHHIKYLLECITGEGCYTDLTYFDFEDMVNAQLLTESHDYSLDRRKDRLIKNVKNLNKTTQIAFPNNCIFEQQLPLENFDVNFVKTLHKHIGEGVIPNAGNFRIVDAKPAQENSYYLSPHLIEGHLTKLLNESRQIFNEPDLLLADVVKYGAYFFSEFLYIHPFSNGNGRVSRLLLSYLLAKYTIVPLSLYTANTARETYLQCLRETREGFAEFKKPASLSRFILENIEREFLDLSYLMDFGF